MTIQPVWRGIFVVLLLLLVWPGDGFSIPLTNTSNKHNMSSSATTNTYHAQLPATGGTDQICIFCHTPHSAAPESTLWSRPDPNTASFPLYAQPLAIKGDIPGKLNANAVNKSQYTNTGSTPGGTPVTYPNGASRMCLSCHDGATAIGILRDNTTIAMAGGRDFIIGSAVIDLSTSHPISFVYNTGVLGDILTARGVGTYKLPSKTDSIDTPLDGKDRMQCTTCHDPHDDTRAAVGYPFWRQTGATAYNDVCNACHIAPPSTLNPDQHHLP